MFGRRLRTLVQQLTFWVTGLAFVLGVASMYLVPADSPADNERTALVDDSEEMGDSADDSLDVEDELSACLGHESVHWLQPPPLVGILGPVHAARTPASPFLDRLTRPPLSA